MVCVLLGLLAAALAVCVWLVRVWLDGRRTRRIKREWERAEVRAEAKQAKKWAALDVVRREEAAP